MRFQSDKLSLIYHISKTEILYNISRESAAEWIDRAALVAQARRAAEVDRVFPSLRENRRIELEVARRSENRHNDGDARTHLRTRVRDCVTESATFS